MESIYGNGRILEIGFSWKVDLLLCSMALVDGLFMELRIYIP
jgi:hypothetical protein